MSDLTAGVPDSVAPLKDASQASESKGPSTTTNTNRQSIARPISLAAPPPEPFLLKISSSALLADKVILTGPNHITIAAHAALHPFARLNSESGAIRLGEYSVIWERAVIGTIEPDGPELATEGTVETLGVELDSHISIGSGAVVHGPATRIGASSIIGAGARIGSGCVLGSYCKIGPCEVVPKGTVLEDYTVMYGNGMRRVNKTTMKFDAIRAMQVRGAEKQVEIMGKLVKVNVGKWT